MIFTGIFLILHGLVHVLYTLHARQKIQLSKDLNWPDHSFLLSSSLTAKQIRRSAVILSIISSIGFIAAGLLLFFKLDEGKICLLTAIIISSLSYLIFWDGTFKKMQDQGFIGILINIAVFISVFIYHWPN